LAKWGKIAEFDEYLQRHTTILERINLNIVPMMPYADVVVLTQGILRQCRAA